MHLADVHRVDGLDGIYIASQFLNMSNLDDQVSLISFNKGGSWHKLTAPERNSLGTLTNCKTNLWRWWGATEVSIFVLVEGDNSRKYILY